MVMCCVFLQDKDTPLHHAATFGQVAAIELLLKYGAEINQANIVS